MPITLETSTGKEHKVSLEKSPIERLGDVLDRIDGLSLSLDTDPDNRRSNGEPYSQSGALTEALQEAFNIWTEPQQIHPNTIHILENIPLHLPDGTLITQASDPKASTEQRLAQWISSLSSSDEFSKFINNSLYPEGYKRAVKLEGSLLPVFQGMNNRSPDIAKNLQMLISVALDTVDGLQEMPFLSEGPARHLIQALANDANGIALRELAYLCIYSYAVGSKGVPPLVVFNSELDFGANRLKKARTEIDYESLYRMQEKIIITTSGHGRTLHITNEDLKRLFSGAILHLGGGLYEPVELQQRLSTLRKISHHTNIDGLTPEELAGHYKTEFDPITHGPREVFPSDMQDLESYKNAGIAHFTADLEDGIIDVVDSTYKPQSIIAKNSVIPHLSPEGFHRVISDALALIDPEESVMYLGGSWVVQPQLMDDIILRIHKKIVSIYQIGLSTHKQGESLPYVRDVQMNFKTSWKQILKDHQCLLRSSLYTPENIQQSTQLLQPQHTH